MSKPVIFDGSMLRERWRLPEPAADDSKHERGTAVVIGGASQTPGAVLLAGTAALRVGAGRLQICTVELNASALAVAVPESAVTALPVAPDGGIAAAAADLVREAVGEADAVLLGPGMIGPEDALTVVEEAIVAAAGRAVIVLDALAVTCGIVNTADFLRYASRMVITPNASEVQHLLGSSAPDDDAHSARMLADRFGVVAMVGSAVASPNGDCWRTAKGNSGLATSGSGDVLAGVVVGLAARGADPLRAALWAVTLHSGAGDRLAQRIGPLGFLARDLLDELSGVLRDL
jgi:hydroxyethylthiazole kinase-like uncharacterized protein yjeF